MMRFSANLTVSCFGIWMQADIKWSTSRKRATTADTQTYVHTDTQYAQTYAHTYRTNRQRVRQSKPLEVARANYAIEVCSPSSTSVYAVPYYVCTSGSNSHIQSSVYTNLPATSRMFPRETEERVISRPQVGSGCHPHQHTPTNQPLAL